MIWKKKRKCRSSYRLSKTVASWLWLAKGLHPITHKCTTHHWGPFLLQVPSGDREIRHSWYLTVGTDWGRRRRRIGGAQRGHLGDPGRGHDKTEFCQVRQGEERLSLFLSTLWSADLCCQGKDPCLTKVRPSEERKVQHNTCNLVGKGSCVGALPALQVKMLK
jgi:hypothetical protein